MSKKSILSFSLVLTMLASLFVLPAYAVNTDDDTLAQRKQTKSAYNLADNVQDGNILHAFNWHFNDVSDYMKEIALAGFTSVQVSPVQGSKITTNVQTYACDWWALYQPINFSIGNSLGTKKDFENMCDKAEQYNVKIIVDIVANHMAQADSGVAGKIHPDVIEDLRTDKTAFHRVLGNTTDASRYDMTQKKLSGIPDLNTSYDKVQSYVKSLLKECIDAGADGFRFDAAKHIELPTDDAEIASNFWPNVVGYAKSIKPDIYIYGEILAPFGTATKNYTDYMKLTDSSYGNTVRSAIQSSTASSSLKSYKLDTDASNLVTWVESHDNFAAGSSSRLTHQQLLLGWGIVGARKDATALYLVRPEHEKVGQSVGSTTIAYDEPMGGPGNLLWEDKTVAEINKFRNNFAGQSETLSTSGSQYYIQRGQDGMVVVNFASSQANISYKTTMTDGTYTDYVSNSEFTVSNGTLTGSIPAKTVAVIYNKTVSTPVATVSIDGKEVKVADTLYFTNDTAEVTVNVNNPSRYMYSINGSVYQFANNGTSFTIGKDVKFGEEIKFSILATDETSEIVTVETYKIVKKDPNGKVSAYFDITGNESWIGESGVYCYVKDMDGNELVEYPGYKMEKIAGTNYYKALIPNLNKAIVKFNEGPVSTGLDGRTIPPTVVEYGSAVLAKNRESGGFEAVGSMVWTNGKWQNFVNPPSEGRLTECDKYALGDVNGDGKLNVMDAVLIQQILAKFSSPSEEALKSANIDGKNNVTIFDLSLLQNYYANINVPYSIGYPVDEESIIDPEEPTEYTVYFNNYKDWKDLYVYYWENGGQVLSAWPGDEVTTKVNDDVYAVTLPIKANAVIFNNGLNGSDQSEEIIIEKENHGKMITACKNYDDDYGIWTDLNDFPDIPDNTTKLYFTNSTKWNKVNCYMYKSGTGKSNGWPGKAMTYERDDADGNKIYSFEYEEGEYDVVIFNNGGSQSADIPMQPGNNNLYTPNSKYGKFTCTVSAYR